jgi:hypothetical protein
MGAMPSTVITSFAYDAANRRLRVVFVSGLVYDDLEVPEKTYQDMRSSFSKGDFLNKYIKPKYAFEKIKE